MISGERWMFMWRSAPESCSFTQLVSQAVAKYLRVRPPDGAAELGRTAVRSMIEAMQRSLRDFGVAEYDHWAYESSLYEGDPSATAHTLELLERAGHTYTSEGALWLRTTAFGDDKDRVLVRS